MHSLGVCPHTGVTYEGSHVSGGFRINPTPLLIPVRFENEPFDPSVDRARVLPSDIFREDSFEATTRIRRGRVYTRRNQAQPWKWYVQDPLRTDLEIERYGSGAIKQRVELSTYHRAELKSRGVGPALPRVILGNDPFVTFWTLVLVETSATEFPILTLRAVRTFGDLPELKVDKLALTVRATFIVAWGHLVEVINRGSPADVVDRCRDVLALLFRIKTRTPGKELHALINLYVHKKSDKTEDLLSWCGRIVARLHARKPSKQLDDGLRELSEDDAVLAIKCVAFVVSELGFAR